MNRLEPIEGLEGEVVLMDRAGPFGVPVVQITTTTKGGAKLGPKEVALMRDTLSEWLRDRGRE